MTREQALKHAKIAYREIMDVIENIEIYYKPIDFSAHWDGCVSIGEWLFHEHELRKDDKA